MSYTPGEILISEEQIQGAVDKIATAINAKYKNEEVLIVGILKGSFVFMADLIRKLTCSVKIDFMSAKSYGDGTISCGRVNITKECDMPIRNQHVLIVEDIVDSGCTTSFLKRYFEDKGAKSVRLCALISKPSRRKIDVNVDFLGFDIPDEFIVGYGLDYAENFRNFSKIHILDT
ncbi:MAG: hypoxanthine phosphoribosyltransferase [Chloroflexi bacterium]|nr:hypoxanthine phosphoribosyltransferase [Chloroflexota bacterium]